MNFNLSSNSVKKRVSSIFEPLCQQHSLDSNTVVSRHQKIKGFSKTIILSLSLSRSIEHSRLGRTVRAEEFGRPWCVNSWVSLLQKSEFAAQILGFEKLGLGLDNCGQTTKNAYCPIYSLWFLLTDYCHLFPTGMQEYHVIPYNSRFNK